MMANLGAIHDQLQGALGGTAVHMYCDAADPPVPSGF
jgi:hypothetical protein